jgi:hypothetical protein
LLLWFVLLHVFFEKLCSLCGYIDKWARTVIKKWVRT